MKWILGAIGLILFQLTSPVSWAIIMIADKLIKDRK